VWSVGIETFSQYELVGLLKRSGSAANGAPLAAPPIALRYGRHCSRDNALSDAHMDGIAQRLERHSKRGGQLEVVGERLQSKPFPASDVTSVGSQDRHLCQGHGHQGRYRCVPLNAQARRAKLKYVVPHGPRFPLAVPLKLPHGCWERS